MTNFISKVVYILILIVVVVGFSAIGRQCGQKTSDMLFNKDEDINMVLFKTADEFNRQVPLMIDSETECFSVTAGSKLITYSYRMVNYKVSDLDLKKFKELFQQQIQNVYCTQDNMKTFRTYNVKMVYKYYDKNKKFISEVFADNSSCN
jgi:hypothetical protein